MSAKISIKEYVDYRTYLKDYIALSKKNGDNLTNRSFAAALGIATSSWLTTVLNGKKGITTKTAEAISRFIGHDDWEQEYFKILVDFNQAKTVEQRNSYFNELKQQLLKKGYYAVKVLETDQYEYYSKWYFSAVRAILCMVPLGDEYEKIARLVSPSITASKAKKAVKVLCKLGLIEKCTEGHYVLTNKAISTGYNVRSLAVANFQRETMRLGSEAIDRYPHKLRDISTLSVGISEEGFKKIVSLIADCRKAIVEVASQENLADRIYQINFQAFPLSKITSSEEPQP